MSLPPDPHDDDLAPPDALSAGAVPPPPPPPPPPPSPDIAPLASAAAALGRDLGRTGPGSVGPVPSRVPDDAPAWASGPPTAPPSPSSVPAPPSRPGPPSPGPPSPPDLTVAGERPATPPPIESPRRGRGKVLLAVGALVAVVAVVAGVALAGGGDDDETTSPASDSEVADAGDGAAAADEPADVPATGAPADTGAATPPPPAPADDPVVVAEAMFTAVTQNDCAEVVRHMTPEAYGPNGETEQQAVAACQADTEAAAQLAGSELIGVTLVSEAGDAAVVSVTLQLGGEQSTRDVPMERRDGVWKVAIAA